MSALALCLIGVGIGLLLAGPQTPFIIISPTVPPEMDSYLPVRGVRPDWPTQLAAGRVIVGDALARHWPDPGGMMCAMERGRISAIRDRVLGLPRTGSVQELVLWLGNEEFAFTQDAEVFAREVETAADALIRAIAPQNYVIVAPQPVWSDPLSIRMCASAADRLRERFPGRVVDPYPALQAALHERAPVYYDDFQLTVVGYAHVAAQVNRGLGHEVPELAPSYGIEQFGRMRHPIPMGMSQRPAG